jgi:hypothetical protein
MRRRPKLPRALAGKARMATALYSASKKFSLDLTAVAHYRHGSVM